MVSFGKNVNIWLGFAGKGTASAGTAWAGLRGCAADRKMRMVRVFWSESILCHSMHGRGHSVPGGHQDDFPGVPFVTTVWCFTVRTCGRLSVLG